MPIVNGLIYASSGDAITGVAADLLTGKTMNNEDGINILGTMPNRGAVSNTIANNGGTYTIPDGYHNGGGVITAAITNLLAANVKQGVSVGGVAGTFPNDGSAVATDVLTGKTFYAGNSTVKTGSMANNAGNAAGTITTQNGSRSIAAGYHNAGTVTAAFANLVAGNVKSGVDIGGVIGSLAGANYATGQCTWAKGQPAPDLNLGFMPKFLIMFRAFQNSSLGSVSQLLFLTSEWLTPYSSAYDMSRTTPNQGGQCAGYSTQTIHSTPATVTMLKIFSIYDVYAWFTSNGFFGCTYTVSAGPDGSDYTTYWAWA